MSMLQSEDFLDCWNSIDKDLGSLDPSGNSVQMVVFLLWRLWKNRNDMIFNQNTRSESQTVAKGLEDFNEHQSTSINPLLTTHKVSKINPPLDIGDFENNFTFVMESLALRAVVQWAVKNWKKVIFERDLAVI
ncbi:conserved hypothetical protein [Ricinus communis]|uniref:Uncharacterized protein n=1 Tax=Ricinus communis TaxID=3988 RepID=B9RZ88_RICCO|nr:conserved hypothetical protein [Ricinus communis]